ncbi:5-(carboxyamino)imidazole ribonucleotide synthase [Texcoconibacillus texcoconensis]|uniref:N5-carboxyaminoimidazole ribonucleotide synthase n=1 Tax=Texcoconibacillus texcoconensis TaxID=1095777 RepID=A0A840QMI3_9BACI|nr:5-(carboxyamino)imidazole ribonucleotide synthase [Texcoconibacillus texcoconensis]MBB5172566.1 5-(carboxyamino)imidazole ribonucleotide synthase [Texcoconibacillus texcoconensis]
MTKTLAPGAMIGIIGGGQLGRMMALAAKAMGDRIAVLDPNEKGPCAQVADDIFASQYNDQEAAVKLAEKSDVVTYEFENIDTPVLEKLITKSYVPQGSFPLSVSQHRLREKEAFKEVGAQVVPYRPVSSRADIDEALQEWHSAAVLKTCSGGYDGKGQRVIKTKQEAKRAWEDLCDKGDLILEKFVSLKKELSVVATRNTHGEMSVFPLAENEHRNNVLHCTIAPARVSEKIALEAEEIARNVAKAWDVVGTFAIEFFLDENDRLYVNEWAPRPHNSGHYTIEACETSQFAQHIRAVTGRPLGSPRLLRPAVMINILGEHVPGVNASYERIGNKGHIHFYGKDEAKVGRKMGHITFLGETVEEAIQKSEPAQQIWQQDDRKEEVGQ